MDTVGDHMRATAAQAAGTVSSAVVPIYRASDEKPAFVGSGLLLSIGSRRLLLTAAHVLDDTNDAPLLGFTNGIRSFGLPQILKTPLPPNGRFHDPLDFGVVTLTDEDVAELPDRLFIPFHNITLQTTPSEGAIVYSVLGYPELYSSEDKGNRIAKAELKHWFDLDSDPEVYRRLKLDRRAHILVRHDKKASRTPKGVGPPFRLPGMSGCGVWKIHLLTNYTGTTRPPLAGVFIERRPRYARALVAVRMAVVLAAVSRHWRDVRELLPAHLI